MHAARDKPTSVRSAGLPPGGGCGPGLCGPDPAEGGRASSRSIFASCSVRRVSCSSARLICSWACASRSSSPAIRASWGLISFGSGVEFISVSLSVQCHPKVPGRPAASTPVLSKEWPYDGENGRMTEECGRGIRRRATAGGGAETARRLSSSVPLAGRRRTQFMQLARQDAHARMQGQTDRRNTAFHWPPVPRGIP